MASLSLTFPEKEQPTIIVLTGARLTIGRLPFNTIQIIDRTISGFHAELIQEHGHYRLHDRGSSNGTYVNGQKITDFHLNDACTIAFGTVEAKFSPEDVPAHEEAESFPTRSEINSVRKENAELRATVEALREEAAALRQARPLENDEAKLAVTKAEFDQVVVERETLKETRLKLEEEVERLKTDLAVLKRDRVNLQLAYDGVQRELGELREKAGGKETETVALAPKAAALAVAAQAASLDETMRIEVPGPAAELDETMRIELPRTAASEPAAKPAAPPAAPFQPKPVSTPKAPPAPFKPLAPMPKAPAVAANDRTSNDVPHDAPPKAPPGLGGGIRPLGKPLPTARLPIAPTVKLAAAPAPAPGPGDGPKGTQKISE